MGELQLKLDNSPELVEIIWCFYPIAIIIEIGFFFTSLFNDDKNKGEAMIPLLWRQASQS